MALIDLSNYANLLNQETTGIGDRTTTNGNVYFDTANQLIQLITFEESPTVIITDTTHPLYTDGTSTIANPLTEDDGIKLEALYAFERQERRKDETLRGFDLALEGSFKFAGAYNFVNGWKLDDADGSNSSLTIDDRFKVRGSGWTEYVGTDIGRIYYGNKSLGNIEALSQPYYQLALGGAPVNYDKDGPIDEAVQVYGDAAVDTNTTTFDTRTYEALQIRTYGNNYDTKILSDSGVTQMDAYSSGFALAESVHLTTSEASMPLANVYNAVPASQVGVWLNMTLEELDVAQTETGFTTADGDFTWVLNNPGNANLDQCIAYLDAIAQTDDDINAHATNVTNGKRVGTWYTYNAAGKILPRTNIALTGLFIEGLVGTDKNRVIFTDDAGDTKLYPSYSNVTVAVGAGAVADPNAWFHAFFADGPGAGDDFNTSGALTVQNAQAANVKGNVDGTGLSIGTNIVFEFDWYGDTIGGPIETDKSIVFECEGDGGVTAAQAIFDLTSQASISASCIPSAETNV